MAAAFFCGRVESRFDGYFLGYVTGSGYSMRDDRLGIHRECRRFFFLLSTAGAHLGNVVSIR